eukprot:Colp12_sorted_trinity150504_noHs@23228
MSGGKGGSVFEGYSPLSTPLEVFIIQLLLVVALSRFLGYFLKKLNQPLVIAEVVAGILLGPTAFGRIPGYMDALFPASSTEVLNVISNIGLVLFMFLIGLELDPKLLAKSSKSSFLISAAGIIVPFGVGTAVSYWLYEEYGDRDSVSFLNFLLFTGVAMSITAFPVLARILAERRLLLAKVGVITMGAAAVDDVVAWVILALVVSIVRATGGSKFTAIYTAVSAFGYILFLLVVVRVLLKKLVSHMNKRPGVSQLTAVVMFLGMFFSAWVTEFIGIHAIFGAFAFGIIVPRERDLAGVLGERIEDLVVPIFLPLYFAFSGLRTNIGLLDDGKAWGFTILIIFTATLGKFGGCALVARMTGHKWRESLTLGCLMNTKGLVELVVLNIGLDYNVITPTVFAMCVVMALVTTFMTTPISVLLYPKRLILADSARQAEERRRSRRQQRKSEQSQSRDVDRFAVLLALNSQEDAMGLVTVGASLLSSKTKQRAMHIMRPFEMSDRPSTYMRQIEDIDSETSHMTEMCLDRAIVLGVEQQTHVVPFASSDNVEDVADIADAKSADLVLLGDSEAAIDPIEVSRRFYGTTGVVLNRGLTVTLHRVLVVYKGTAACPQALNLAFLMAKTEGTKVTILLASDSDFYAVPNLFETPVFGKASSK